MGTSLTLFRAFGVDVRVHWSFVLVLAYGAVVYSGRTSGVIAGALYGILITLLLFACVTLHEFGHALVAQRYNIRVPTITLLPIGGVATLEKMPEQPRHELFIAIAGPLVNLAIAAILFPFVLVIMGFQVRSGFLSPDISAMLRNVMTPGFGNLMEYLVVTNILLALFNLLPAFPMDGGRVLRALLALTMPYVRATRIAVRVGRVMAVLLALWGILGGGIFLLLIAFFVYVGGGSELGAVQSKSILRKISARRALTPTAVSLYVSEPVNRAADLIMQSYQTDYPVMDLGGKFVGVLTRPRLIQALRENGPDARVVDVMLPATSIPHCSPDEDLSIVWEKMTHDGSRVVAIQDESGFLGLITADDLTEVIHVAGAANENAIRRGNDSLPPSITGPLTDIHG